jgi:lipopolysaccharide/colanic/teichoic acid biosynthesis glycosyltransferase
MSEAVSAQSPTMLPRPIAPTLREDAADRLQRSRRAAWDASAPLPRTRSKRLFDLAAVALSTPITLPAALLLGVLIRLDSPGPALFFQRRYGRNGRKFTLIKFRTMRVDAREALADHLVANAQHAFEWAEHRKLRDDPRVTRVGRFLRRTSLDELPQLWNVLRGEMSLVGPRPLPVCERVTYGRAFRIYARVTPGLTGLWQISGRSDLPYSRRVALDTLYVRHRSLRLDLSILRRTLGAVLSAKGAY